jgi:hypothetical protein
VPVQSISTPDICYRCHPPQIAQPNSLQFQGIPVILRARLPEVCAKHTICTWHDRHSLKSTRFRRNEKHFIRFGSFSSTPSQPEPTPSISASQSFNTTKTPQKHQTTQSSGFQSGRLPLVFARSNPLRPPDSLR